MSESEIKEHEIFTAIYAFDLAKVREILATPAAANERNEAGLTPLMVLSSTTLHELSYYAKLKKLQALGLVAEDAAEQVVRNKFLLIIENMAKVVATTPDVDLNAVMPETGKAALHMAADSNNEDLVNVLIDAKADLNLQDTEGRTALFDASSFTVRRALVYAGADLAILDKHGNTVLHHILWKHVPDTPSSSMIAKMAPELLLVKNNVGRTPQELAEETVKQVNERATALAAADALRPKREWEEAFMKDTAAGQAMHDMVVPTCPCGPHQPKHKPKSCFKRLLDRIRNFFSCSECNRLNKTTNTSESKKPTVTSSPTSNLTANHLIYGSWEGASATHEKPKDVLLRSDPLKGEFVNHAGSCLGAYEDICAEEDEKDFYRPSNAPHGEPDVPHSVRPTGSFGNEPEAVAAGEPQPEGDRQPTTPLHRQSNFTSEEEPAPSQFEKEMDEVFSILRSEPAPAPAPAPAIQPPTQTQEQPEQPE